MEKEKLVELLKEIRNLAGEMSMTGMYRHAGATLIKFYNRCLEEAKRQGLLQNDDLFAQLEENSNIDDVGVCAALLARYLRDDVGDEIRRIKIKQPVISPVQPSAFDGEKGTSNDGEK